MAYRHLIDWKAYFEEETAAELLSDPEEIALREKLLEELKLKEMEYNEHINNYDLLQHCKMIEARGLRFKPLSKKTVTRKWDAYFAAELSPKTKREIYYSQFKWHIFSYEKVPARKGDEARAAFNCCDKGAAYLFIQCTEEAWYIENAQLLTAADLDVDYSFQKADVYIFDAKGEWTYARTHEEDCGPYFFQKG